MKKLLLSLLCVCSVLIAEEIDMNPSKGVDQSSIVSLIPNASSWDVDQNVTLQAKFSVELDAKHVQKNNVKLQRLITEDERELIKGEVGFDVEENSVTFTPETILVYGYYEVAFKSLKAVKTKKEEKIKEIKYRFYVPELINGHKLPPEPDEAMNNATVLGVDRNGNEVRDDVERWIYINYQSEHPIYIDIAMQGARGYKKILEDYNDVKEVHKDATSYIDCESYYKYYAKYFNESILINKEVSSQYFIEKIYFNTSERKALYSEYANLLSGDSYSLPKIEETKSFCDFNTSKY